MSEPSDIAALQVRVAELEQALAGATRLKDEFLASMSHELRTPLNAVLGVTEDLQSEVYGPLTSEQQDALQTIAESGRHLLATINDILDLARIEAGKMALTPNLVMIEPVCRACLRLLSKAASRKSLSLITSFDAAAPTLLADERRLKQILVNLLSNAVKFTPEGGTVGLEVLANAQQNEVAFIVWDTGIGIAPDDIGRLFQPFVQLDSGLARHYEGTGLGLALVARLTHLHNGRVGVSSILGQGSRFTVSMPWLREESP